MRRSSRALQGCTLLPPSSSASSHVKSFETGYADRFAGPDSLYRKGLRRSTVPEARDPTSFPSAKPSINKGNARGAALKANLKAMISKDVQLKAVAEEAEEDLKENAIVA